CQQQDNPPLTF
nr:immunoglobulin light chain junction region [Macaca mulatta]MOX47938.1 immunoglobulin light chain junction region [Macaca mulatta]MOX47982.1 immunoglobulin light chain junction region [Macaca mulatta]MOX48102.1 immunoglobulin light chain junction region [Macaca mulatta]MOX48279.1 immunoglobulin light chain junction region [Macaca mulatta]